MKIFAILILLISFSSFSQTAGDGVNDIDGNSYPTVILGNQEWMGENLRVASFNNGDEIPDLSDYNNWFNQSGPGWCNYDNNPVLDLNYGKLYNYDVVDNQLEVCPVGWHIPSTIEWNELIEFLGGLSIAGGLMKVDGTDFWSAPNTNANNSSLFSALPGGYRATNGTYIGLYEYGFYWTSTPQTSAADIFYLSYDSEEVSYASGNFSDGLSIRCMRPYSSLGLAPIELNKNLIQILDMMGRETTFKPNTPLIYVYDDGSTEKVFTIE